MGSSDDARKNPIAVFDLEGTLVNGDATFQFVYFCLRRSGNWAAWLELHIRETLHTLKLAGLGKKDFGIALQAMRPDQVNTLAKEYARILWERKNDEVLRELENLKRSGYKTLLITGAWQPIAEAFAHLAGMDEAHGSTLQREMKGNKSNRAGTPEYFFSDNPDDLDAMRHAKHPVGVVWSKIEKKWWEEKGVQTLYICPATNMSPWKLWIPGLYSMYGTKRGGGFLRYAAQIVPLILGFFFLSPLSGSSLFTFFIAWVAYASLYEVGYFTNDTYAIRSEQYPTYRISRKTQRMVPWFIAERIGIAALCVWLIHSVPFIWGLFFVLVMFSIYNFLWREQKWITGLTLSSALYFVPLIPVTAYWWWGIAGYALYRVPENMVWRHAHDALSESPSLQTLTLLYCGLILITLASLIGFLFFGIPGYLLGVGIYFLIWKGAILAKKK